MFPAVLWANLFTEISFVSVIVISPDVLFNASNVVTVVSIAAEFPIPLTADIINVAAVMSFTVSTA